MQNDLQYAKNQCIFMQNAISKRFPPLFLALMHALTYNPMLSYVFPRILPYKFIIYRHFCGNLKFLASLALRKFLEMLIIRCTGKPFPHMNSDDYSRDSI